MTLHDINSPDSAAPTTSPTDRVQRRTPRSVQTLTHTTPHAPARGVRSTAAPTASATLEPLDAGPTADHSSADADFDDFAEDDAEAAPQERESVLDSLSHYLGPIPWWLVSTAFHVVLFVLFVLLMTEVPKDATIVTIKGAPIEQIPPPPEEDKKVEVFKSDRIVEFNTDQPPVPDAEVPMEHIEDTTHNETEDNMDSNTARGDLKNIGSVNLGGYGAVGVMGVGGGGGGGAYGTRTGGGRRKAALRGGGSKGSEGAVDLALEWLAKHQETDGHWDTVKYAAEESGRCDTAATGLAALAFLGAGNTDKRGQWKDNVKRAMDWIIKQQNADGCIMPNSTGKEVSYGPGYHHAICGLALAECYGMGHSVDVKTAAQKAVTYSVEMHQDGEGSEKLGWRYTAKVPGDMSVSGWFIMQLKSARLAGLAVPQQGFQGAITFLDSIETKAESGDPYSGHRYGYSLTNLKPEPMTTMIGCTARMFLGWPKEELEPAVKWAIEKQGNPHWGDNGSNVNWYFWYYGTMTTFQIGGDVWKDWNAAMRDLLVDKQRKDGDEKGSWDPTGSYQNLGRVYSTANGALCLEVYYRYSPLYGPGAAKH